MGNTCTTCNCYYRDENGTEFHYPTNNGITNPPPIQEPKKVFNSKPKALDLQTGKKPVPTSFKPQADTRVKAFEKSKAVSPTKELPNVVKAPPEASPKDMFESKTEAAYKEETESKSMRIDSDTGFITEEKTKPKQKVNPEVKKGPSLVENYVLETGEVYTGTLKDNKRSGNGTLIWPNGDKYVGGWENDLFEGHGTFTQQSGETYEGEWKAGKLCGLGKVVYPNGYFLEAVFDNDMAHGMGKEIDTDGKTYEGEFQNGKKEGKGKILWKDGKVYEGEFLDNVMHGKGKLLRPDGSSYEGDFARGKQDGYGIYKWKDGRRYEGEFVGGKQHGIGLFVAISGEQKKGRWENGKRIAWLDENGNEIGVKGKETKDSVAQ